MKKGPNCKWPQLTTTSMVTARTHRPTEVTDESWPEPRIKLTVDAQKKKRFDLKLGGGSPEILLLRDRMRARERERRVWELGSPHGSHPRAAEGGSTAGARRARAERRRRPTDTSWLAGKGRCGTAIANFLLRIYYMEPDSTESSTDGRWRSQSEAAPATGTPARARLCS